MKPTALERALSRIAPVRAGEGAAVGVMFAQAFVLLFAYYLVKPAREALILTEASAEVRSYAVALQALVLMAVVPLYGALFRRLVPHYWIATVVTAFLALNLPVFVVLDAAGFRIGVEFFVWLGVFNVLIVAQFWAVAADLFSVEAGERLFVLIALGTSVGAWLGALASKALFATLGASGLMLLAAALLLATLPLTPLARRRVPERSRAPQAGDPPGGLRGALVRVLADPYLRLLAIFVVLLNGVNSTGEYLLARIVREHAASLAASGAIADTGAFIGGFYGDFYAWVNLAGLLIQVLLVARIFRTIGVSGAILVLPVVAAAGYGLLAFIPVFAAVRAVKLLENSVNYSLQNTARHALILPTDTQAKYAGKTAIDTLFWRLGDLGQAAVVWCGVELFAASPAHFAMFNAALSLVWLAVAAALGRRYRRLAECERPPSSPSSPPPPRSPPRPSRLARTGSSTR